ncbi:TetR/AcrR family transcriptional regulator [Cohnella sp. GCM10027633]|uniref:TetR/AcrR family transcriptional regulator n=1 Tax=unclassified Cohnella TaxID=2636738 RepID=UPI003641EEA7
MIKPSLRDLKKEATAHALAEAAFELALERGMNGFVVEDVVQRAGYSRRTFANYFSCKEEAVAMVAEPFHGVDEAIDCLERMTGTTNPLDALHGFMMLQLTGEYFRKMRTLVGLAKSHQTLLPYILSVHYKMQEAARQVLDHLFPDRSPTYTRLLTCALTGAILPMFDGSMNVLLPGQPSEEGIGAVSFDAYMDTVFGHLRNGF